MEYWIFFDIATGAELWRGSGTTGNAAIQPIPDGAGMVIVPQAVVASPTLDLGVLRTVLCARIDAEAEAVRQRFITPGPGQAMEYVYVAREALDWQADNTAPVPFIAREAALRGVPVADIVAEVSAASSAWGSVIGPEIRAVRMKAKSDVMQAPTLGAIVAASVIDWSALAP